MNTHFDLGCETQGTGQHCAFFAEFFPHVTIWPTEFGGGSAGPEADAYGSLAPVFASIESYSAQLANVRKPIELDAGAAAWPEEIEATRFGAVYACNVCHISPYAVTEGILAGASRVLAPSGGLFLVSIAPTAMRARVLSRALSPSLLAIGCCSTALSW